MKGAIVCADKVSTVSPRYAEEIMWAEYAHGLEGILRENAYKVCGILNGIDYVYYDPSKDKEIVKNYTWRSLDKKNENKRALQRDAGLPERDEVPLIAIITRLAAHKGLDIICEMVYNLIENNDVQLVVLGKGEARYEEMFKNLRERFPDKVAAYICYDRALSKRIYAAADIFMMPSKSEPCGLSQMIASRYGAIPVVRETGGLYDSIKGYYEEKGRLMGNGFTFANYSSDELLERSLAAVSLWQDTEKRKKFVGKIMRTDFSWSASAEKYVQMYDSLL
jgi:starch synthase